MTNTRNDEDNGKLLYCSFCGRSQHKVRKLIAGPSILICGEYVDLCSDIIRKEVQEMQAEGSGHKLLTPKEVRIILDRYMIGWERAGKTLVVTVYNHYKRFDRRDEKDDIKLGRNNILMIDLADSDKTLLAGTLTRLLNVPFTIADAATLTETGYVGKGVENIIQKFLQECDYGMEKIQIGIVYIDKVDKTSWKSDNPSTTHNVSGKGVRQILLKLIEGTVASIPPQGDRKYPQQEFLQADTHNILFICGSAFAGSERVVRSRSTCGDVGFNAEMRS